MRLAILASSALLALAGCEQAPTALEPTSSPTALYQSFPIASDGYRLVPGGQVLWDTSFSPNKPARYDQAKEVLISVDSLFVDTAWGVISNPKYKLGTAYEAILAANAKSKQSGFDSVYVYDSTRSGALYGLVIRKTNGYRIPNPREAKYLLWAGSKLTLPWGSGSVNATWAKANVFGDSLSGIKNNFGAYVFFKDPRYQDPAESFAPAYSLEEGYHTGTVYPPCPDNETNDHCLMVLYSRSALGPDFPPVFVRSVR